jgi:6-phosphogluconolactonase
MAGESSGTVYVYVGTYTQREPHVQGQAEGIYVFTMDTNTGNLAFHDTTSSVVNPSFLTTSPSKRNLYAVNETQQHEGRPGGAVSAFAIERSTGKLRYINQQPSHGTGPCHLCADQTGRFVLVANYNSGSIAAFPILAEGALGAASAAVQHEGSSLNPQRQQGPHAHSINLDPGNNFALVADLGLDKVLVYKLDHERGTLVPNDPSGVSVHPEAGPRHLAFHPNGRFVYLIDELDSTMITFAYDADRGTLTALQTLPTLPDGFGGRNHTADTHVSPSGRFVYGSNRGHDSIAIFAIDDRTGTLTVVGHESTRGRTPRNFAIDPSGAFLYAANQDSSTIVVFRIDQQTGALTPTGHVVQTPTPVCVHIVSLGA